MSLNDEFFQGKTFQDVFQENYREVLANRHKLDIVLEQVSEQIDDIQDAVVVVPLIEKIYAMKIKNEELNIKMLSVAEKKAKSLGVGDEMEDDLSPEMLSSILSRREEISKKIEI